MKAIAAMSLNRVIGQGSKIPWHISEDFKWFKKMTTGQIIVMGRKTFESIGKPLPNRTTLVVTRSNIAIPGVQTISDLSELEQMRPPATCNLQPATPQEIFICGGAQLYEQALPRCSDLYLTLVKREVEGDVFFPKFEHLFAPVEEILDRPEFKITHFRNVRI
jgi:dihydrofolate reductase